MKGCCVYNQHYLHCFWVRFNQNKSEINGYGKEIIVWRVPVNFSFFKHYCEDPRFSHLFVI